MQNLKLLALTVAEILKGNPQILGAALAQGHAPFSSACDTMMVFGKPKLLAKFELAFSVAEILTGNPNFCGPPLPQSQAHFS